MRWLLRLVGSSAEKPESDARPRLTLALLGDAGVGKTGLLTRLQRHRFREEDVETIGVDFGFCTVKLDGEIWRMILLDFAGQERLRPDIAACLWHASGASLRRSRHWSQGMVVVYDVTDKESFDNVRHWMSIAGRNMDVDIGRIIVGNKCDLSAHRAVSYEEGQALADYFGVPFLETSAKSDHNTMQIVETFARGAKAIFERRAKLVSLAAMNKRTTPSTSTG
mmetsp:Transcript_9067/g.25992  ORF Transcript_9067/g.25992 Transcript_9067/m.25992 type:complete len:223 (+) Transcript_9067:69-737(+)